MQLKNVNSYIRSIGALKILVREFKVELAGLLCVKSFVADAAFETKPGVAVGLRLHGSRFRCCRRLKVDRP